MYLLWTSPPPSLISNITIAWAVDREFFQILWGTRAPIGSLRGAAGSLWPPLGRYLDHFWVTGCAWLSGDLHSSPFGSPLGPVGLSGAPWVIGLHLDFILPANVAQAPRLLRRSSLPEFARGSFWLPLGCCWAPFASLLLALASSRSSFGSLLGPLAFLGCHLVSIRIHLGLPGVPFGIPGTAWVLVPRVEFHFAGTCCSSMVLAHKIKPPGETGRKVP
jgi:hypothetical protein